MKSIAFLSGLLLFMFFPDVQGTSAGQDTLPAAEVVIERFIQVTGGRPAYEKLHSQITMGSVEFLGAGIKGKFAEYRAEPARIYRSFDFPNTGRIEAGADGDVAWERSSETGPRLKTGDDKAGALRDATFNALLRWRQLYSRVECTGKDVVGGETCYRLLLTPKTGKPVTYWYDLESGLLVKVAMTSETPTLGEILTETFLGDYRNVEGILLPHRVNRKVLSQEILTLVESIQLNAPIPEGRFDIPAEIQTLLKK